MVSQRRFPSTNEKGNQLLRKGVFIPAEDLSTRIIQTSTQ